MNIQSAWTRRRVGALAFAWTALAALAPTASHAQDFPRKPITLVVPVPAGSGADVVARIVAKGMGDRLNQPVVIRNQDGAGGVIGAQAVARAAPDGYTLLMTAGGQAILPSTVPNLPFDVIADFTPVALVSSGPILLVAGNKIPAKTLPEFIAYAKAQPKRVSFADPGAGTVPTLAMYLLSKEVGMELLPVGYRGGAPALLDVAAGNVDVYFTAISAAVPLIQTGKVKALGLSSANVPDFVKAMPAVGDVKPIAQLGVPGFDVGLTYGIFAPAKTPRDVIAALESAIGAVLGTPETKADFASRGFETKFLNSAGYATHFRNEMEQWKKVSGSLNKP